MAPKIKQPSAPSPERMASAEYPTNPLPTQRKAGKAVARIRIRPTRFVPPDRSGKR